MWAAGALRGSPASITATALLARPSTSAALSPAAPPPTTTTSYRCASTMTTSVGSIRRGYDFGK